MIERHSLVHMRSRTRRLSTVHNQVRTGRVTIGDVGKGQTMALSDSIETPYLQLVMSELWRRETAVRSHTLRRETFTDLGGAASIVQII